MRKIEVITGQDILKQTIISNINNKQYIFLIEGELGVGKRYLCELVLNELGKSHFDLFPLILKDDSQYNIEYVPFFNAINEYDASITNKLLSLLEDSSKDMPLFGNSMSALIKFATDNRDKINIKLTEQEKTIIKIYDYLLKNKTGLFICHNINEWDEASQNLLFQLLNSKITCKFLEKSIFLITTNKTNTSTNKIKIHYKTFHFNKIKKDDIKDIVENLSSKVKLDDEKLEILYEITGGNLLLLKEVCKFLENSSFEFFPKYRQIFDLIVNRIGFVSANPDDLVDFIKRASLLGRSSSKTLLKAFSEKATDSFLLSIKETQELELMVEDFDSLSFINSAIHMMFLNNIGENERKYHLLLEKCIKLLSPSEYYMRSIHLLKSGEEKKAIVLYIISLIKSYREIGRKSETNSLFVEIAVKYDMNCILEKILEAYELYFNNKYKEAFNKLININNITEKELNFEIDYLKALIITNHYSSIIKFKEGLQYLEKWVYNQSFYKDESEMWLRAAVLMVDYLYELEKADEMRRLLIRIHHLFDDKIATDKFIEKKYYSFCSKANVYFSIETSYDYTKKAVLFFEQHKENLYNLSKFYIALVNHSANALVMGYIEEAYDNINFAFNIVSAFNNIAFPKLEILVNNLSLIQYISNRISVNEAIQALSNFENVMCNYADELLINNNLVALYALGGNYSKACEISNSLYKKVEEDCEIDPYYKYFIFNNYGIIKYILKEHDIAFNIFQEMKTLVPLGNDASYFSKRTQVLYDFLINGEFDISDENWNNSLLTKHKKYVGDAWEFWAKIMIFSELQTWSDC
jgi:hypothetical protein